jgi:hypothetical protein
MDHFLAGYRSAHPDPGIKVLYLADRSAKKEILDSFSQANEVLMIFPLYTDCMPGMVKEFFEDIVTLGKCKTKKIGFIVQSGFPEAIHSVYVEKYLDKLARKMECQYLGTIIKGGVEGIQIMPAYMTRKLYSMFYQLGQFYGSTGTFSPEIVTKLRNPLRMSKAALVGFRFFSFIGLVDFYWRSQLKKNGAYDQRSQRPYAKTV